jgi:hypothetical protein
MPSLAAIAGTGEAVSAEYVDDRKRIERRHGNDDGTEQHFHRVFGDCTDYADKIKREPLNETDDPSRLIEFGLTARESNRIGEHCDTIHDVRTAVIKHAIPTWHQAGPVTEKHVIAALKKADKVTG